MRVNGFGEYPVNNISSGGQKNSVDAYNKALKGSAYYDYEEYASRNFEEYHHYSEYNDITDKKRDKKDDSSQSDNKKRKNSVAKRQRMIQQVVGLVAGSVVVVTSYQSVLRQQAEAVVDEPTSIVQSVDSGDYDPSDRINPDIIEPTEETTEEETTTQPDQEETTTQSAGETTTRQGQAVTTPSGLLTKWSWSKDNKSATLTITDNRGNVIKKVSATVSVSQKAATCTKEGRKDYTATAEYENKKYTDAKTETLVALGHTFDSGKETVLENGQTAMTFECTRCHEKFVIQTSFTEND